MPRIRVTMYSQSLDEIKHEGLREEAKAWNEKECVIAATAIRVPDDGSGPMEGFYRQPSGPGMVVWGDDMSDWIEAESLYEMFQQYLKGT